MSLKSTSLRLMRGLCLLVPLLALPACYEGWEEEGRDVPVPPEPFPPEIRPISYILFQPISMSQGAINNDTCFPKTGIRAFKTAEWDERIASINEALTKIADIVVVKPVAIGSSDCEVLSAVQAESLKLTPWGDDLAPDDDQTGRSAIHLKAVFWEDDPQLSPPASVQELHWAAWRDLEDSGRIVRSVPYFVLSNPTQGYFSEWRDAVSFFALDGTPINDVDPTPDGVDARRELIATDTDILIGVLLGVGE